MTVCWKVRGCDEEMQSRCPHSLANDSCPVECHFAACDRPTHVVSGDFELLLNPERDYDAAVKEGCRICEFFLVNGPTLDDCDSHVRQGNPNRFIL